MRYSQRGNQGRRSMLDRYGGQLGTLMERRLQDVALLAAKQNAEKLALQADKARHETEQVNVALRGEVEQRELAMADLEHLANHDPLTDLPNRNLFNSKLKSFIDRAAREGRHVGLMLLDLDNFKDVNDTLGHAIGDQLLTAVAARLSNCIRAQDVLARLGGDEFALIQIGLDYPIDAHIQAKRLLKALGEVFTIGDHKLYSGASIGITVFPDDGGDVEQLLQNADLAMYQAKEEQRNSFRFYDVELNASVQRRTFLENELRDAIDAEELMIYFQPKIDIKKNVVAGAEALVRWRHGEQGMISPEEFIPVAERSGLINPIGEWMLRQACRHLSDWAERGLPAVKVAVNLSAVQFRDRDIAKLVSDMLSETGVDASLLELEVTESAAMHDIRNAVGVLSKLHQLGVSLSVDDFGTGYSSLSYLRQLPVHRLKIDKSFISEVDQSREAAAIARAIVMMGQSLGLDVVAEGVETEAQLDYLKEVGCDEVQGYLFGRAMPGPDFEAFMLSWDSD